MDKIVKVKDIPFYIEFEDTGREWVQTSHRAIAFEDEIKRLPDAGGELAKRATKAELCLKISIACCVISVVCNIILLFN